MGKDAVENNLRQVIKDLQRRVGALERGGTGDGGGGAMAASFPTLSDITPDAGLLRAGEFRAGNGVEPGEGFSGVRMTAEGVNGYDNDELEAGMSSSNGKITAGAGNVTLDANGLGLQDNTTTSYVQNKGVNWVNGSDAVASIYLTQHPSSSNHRLLTLWVEDAFDVGTTAYVDTYKGAFVATKFFGNFQTGDDGVLTGGKQAIADDDVFSFTPATSRGVLILRGPGSDSTTYAMLTYAAIAGTAYTIAWVNGSNTAVTTGTLAGTTGTDGKLTISAHTDGKIYIENRRGGSRTLAWQIVAGT